MFSLLFFLCSKKKHLLISICSLLISFGALAFVFFEIKQNVNYDFDHEKKNLIKIQNRIDTVYEKIKKINLNLYVPDYYGNSIPNIIKTDNEIFDYNKNSSFISKKIFDICQVENYITEIIVVDYKHEKFYYATPKSTRFVKHNFDFFDSNLYEKIKRRDNKTFIISQYYPEYILSNEGGYVSCFCQNIYDLDRLDKMEPIGSIIISVNFDVILNPFVSFFLYNGRVSIKSEDNVFLYDNETKQRSSTINIKSNRTGLVYSYFFNYPITLNSIYLWVIFLFFNIFVFSSLVIINRRMIYFFFMQIEKEELQYNFLKQALKNIQQEESQKNVTEMMMDIIKEQYASGVTLKTVSYQLNRSASYLGGIFKKQIGDNFTNVVNEYRIRDACESLVNSNLKIYEISSNLGFQDVHYFIKVFKKYMNVSPMQYRKMSKISNS